MIWYIFSYAGSWFWHGYSHVKIKGSYRVYFWIAQISWTILVFFLPLFLLVVLWCFLLFVLRNSTIAYRAYLGCKRSNMLNLVIWLEILIRQLNWLNGCIFQQNDIFLDLSCFMIILSTDQQWHYCNCKDKVLTNSKPYWLFIFRKSGVG